MRTRLKAVLLAAVALAITFGVIDSQAGRSHSHRVTVKQYFNDTYLPPQNDPASVGVESVSVTCPRGYTATGGGFVSEQLALTPYADLNPGSYGVVAANQTDQGGKLTVTVACAKGKTTARRASAPSQNINRLVKQYRAQARGD